jgi:hypothetical protein
MRFGHGTETLNPNAVGMVPIICADESRSFRVLPGHSDQLAIFPTPSGGRPHLRRELLD